MKRLAIITLTSILIISAMPSSVAAKCEQKVCIKVYTDPATGRVVIEAKKGKPKVVVTYKPKPIIPKPKPTRTWKPRPYTPRPKVSKKPAVSLADQLSKMIPNREITKVPVGDALVAVPVKFSTNTDLLFSAAVKILGTAVNVHLTPSFAWNFGDGSSSNLNIQNISHTYLNEGEYQVVLTVSWRGNWFANGVWSPIAGGAIIKTLTLPVSVKRGPTKYGK
ncbi:MAG: hypothetical protein RL129_618 [Actinomycetota bacterium]